MTGKQLIKTLIRQIIPILFIFFSGYIQAKLLAVTTRTEDTFLNLITTSIEKTADAYGDDVYIDSADNDFDTQYKQIKSFVAAGADAIIIISAGTREQNKKLMPFASKVPLVFINAEPLENLDDMPENTVYVGSNEEESGTMQMEELAKLAGYKGNVVMLQGEAKHPAAVMRTLDVKNVLAKYPNMKLVKSEVANWQRNQAYKKVTQWIKDKVDFQIIAANNDEMAIGAILALQDAGKNPKDYLIGGIDASQDALREMEAGLLDVTVLQDAVTQGKAAAGASYQLINNIPLDKALWVPFRLVTPDNYTQYLKK